MAPESKALLRRAQQVVRDTRALRLEMADNVRELRTNRDRHIELLIELRELAAELRGHGEETKVVNGAVRSCSPSS